jgi:hypothetical protein
MEAFEPGPIEINGKQYPMRPCMRKVTIAVYEKDVSHKGRKVLYRKTERVLELAEVRLVRADGGQTSIVTSREDLTAEQIVSVQLARWGDQENQFKYLLREFDLDALWTYQSEPIDACVDHPHPAYTQLEAELRRAIARRKSLLDRAWRALGETPQDQSEKQRHERMVQWLTRTKGKQLDELNDIEAHIAAIREQMAETPQRQSVAQAGYEQLSNEAKRLTNVIKTVAYELEGTLAEMIEPYYANAENEKRRLIAAALQTSGSFRLEPGELVVRLDPQSAPVRTRAVDALCHDLNKLRATFPGSHRVIRFETER